MVLLAVALYAAAVPVVAAGNEVGFHTFATVVGEAGSVTVSQPGPSTWHTVNLTRTYTSAVVVMGPVSFNLKQPTTVRVRNVTATSFQFQIDEWDYLDGKHGTETVSYVVVEGGRYTLDDGRTLEAGTATVGSAFQTIGFSLAFSAAPTVVSQISTTIGTAAAVTRHRNVTATGFQVRLDGQELTPFVGSETISYIALTPGVGNNGGNPYQVGLTGRSISSTFSTIPFDAAFSQTPTVVASMQTTYGGDPSTLRYQSLTSAGVSMKVEEEQSKDSETSHTAEVVGFFAFQSGPIYGVFGSTSALSPKVTGTSPADGATGVMRDTYVAADVYLPNVGKGIDESTLSESAVRLYPSGHPTELIPANLNTSAAGDAIVLRPLSLLGANTPYTFEVTGSLKDLAGQSFAPYMMSFTTGAQPNGKNSINSKITFERVVFGNTSGKHTSLAIGPDGKLYATTTRGHIKRWNISSDGTLTNAQTLGALRLAEGGDRLAVGLAFDPSATASNLVAWVSHTTYGFNDMPDWGGKITRLSGPNLATVEDYVVNLPRSIRDHVTNSIAFGPDGALYVNQGSNTATGEADDAWGNRPERLLSSAVLRVDIAAIRSAGTFPIDVKTAEGGAYNPYLPGSPVKIFASGLRNAYDLLWHSNGTLYVPTNGSAAGGKAPASVPGTLRPDGSLYNGPVVPAIDNIATQEDYLFRIHSGSGYVYYGHPNPTRGEFVLNGGNPTSEIDRAEVLRYPVGVLPDVKWQGFAYNFGRNISPNGIIEYMSDTFKGALKGKLLVARYSGGDDILALTLDKNGNITSNGDFSITIDGGALLSDPLDLVEHRASGNLYVSEYKPGQIVLLRPSTGTSQVTAEVFDGTSEASSARLALDRMATINVPAAYELSQNNPNPFNPSTEIRFSLPEAAHVRLVVYDLLGRQVMELANGHYDEGAHRVTLDAHALASGVYLYQLETSSFVQTRTMQLIK